MEQSEASTVRVCALMTAVCWFHVMVNHGHKVFTDSAGGVCKLSDKPTFDSKPHFMKPISIFQFALPELSILCTL